MNEKDKLAWERACDALYGFGYSEQFSMALWQAALEYARQPAQAEPVAKAVMGKREVSCHGPNRKYVEGVVIQQLKEIEPETLLYTHTAQPVQPAGAQEPDLLDLKLPIAVRVGGGIFGKGVSLRTVANKLKLIQDTYDNDLKARMSKQSICRENETEAPAVAVNDDLAKAVHYPGCWDVAAYPTLADALRELATCFQCCECVKNPAVAQELVACVLAEVAKATAKFPTWPTDPLHALAVLGEEFGELTQAVLQSTYEPHKSTPDDVKTEAIQTAAMALRFLMSLNRYQFQCGEQHHQGTISAAEAEKAKGGV